MGSKSIKGHRKAVNYTKKNGLGRNSYQKGMFGDEVRGQYEFKALTATGVRGKERP